MKIWMESNKIGKNRNQHQKLVLLEDETIMCQKFKLDGMDKCIERCKLSKFI